jgi:hypothetical protein
MRTEDWSKARISAIKVAQLDPLNASSLLRLSLCYENERNYVKAYEYLRKGMSLSNPTERKSYASKVARLREQADDMAANVIRRDPFEVLPLELITHIMKIGMEDRRDLVLNCTFVSKTWRQTLIHKCPELWGTLTFRWRDMQNKKFNGKLDEWLKRRNKQPHTVDILEDMNSAGVGKIPKDIKWEFIYVRNLRMAMKDNKVLQRFCDKFMGSFCHMEHLSIDGGSIESLREEDEAFTNLHCNLLESTAYQRITTMNIKHVDFRDRYVSEYHRPGGMMVRQLRQTVARKRLQVRHRSESITGTLVSGADGANGPARPVREHVRSYSIGGAIPGLPSSHYAPYGPEPSRTPNRLPSINARGSS